MELPIEKSRKSSKIGLLFVAATGGIATAISVVCFPFVSPAFRKICLPYVPATRQQIKNVIRALNGRSGSLIDLGSGDGRIVLAAAKRGFKAHGIELNTWLVWYSRLQALINGLSADTAFLRRDLWKHHLGRYDNVVIFGVDQMMEDIEKKLNSELGKDSLVIACRFPLPNTLPVTTIGHGVDTVWVYKI
ncbi:PREDICTED: protein FAM173B [Wasmannia auropunctata]|uniref:protein FAM173B n=1 Tax=Wasmannia auropunctata TaxID=64793 RepID=UPI0005EDEE2E|nr:PREDICTED: protein FAM173B [Wasmannia auropunctata]XP_011693234.1 PREDICTED: protein FAM173B [Wasmannia auropunctata]